MVALKKKNLHQNNGAGENSEKKVFFLFLFTATVRVRLILDLTKAFVSFLQCNEIHQIMSGKLVQDKIL